MKQILYLGLDPTSYLRKGRVTHCPFIQIVPRPLEDPAIQQALSQFPSYTHLFLTSKNAFQILMRYLLACGHHLHDWHSKVVIAIGQATAHAMRQDGVIPTHITEEETAEGMTAEIIKSLTSPTLSFWPHSAQARSVLPDFCQTRQIPLIHCALYDTLPYRPDVLPNLEQFDEIVFTSPSTVQAFLAFYGTFPSHKQLTSIGPITAAQLQRLHK